MLVKKLNKCEELREESLGLIEIHTASIYHVAKHEYKLHLLSLISYSNSLLLSTLLFVLDFKVFKFYMNFHFYLLSFPSTVHIRSHAHVCYMKKGFQFIFFECSGTLATWLHSPNFLHLIHKWKSSVSRRQKRKWRKIFVLYTIESRDDVYVRCIFFTFMIIIKIYIIWIPKCYQEWNTLFDTPERSGGERLNSLYVGALNTTTSNSIKFYLFFSPLLISSLLAHILNVWVGRIFSYPRDLDDFCCCLFTLVRLSHSFSQQNIDIHDNNISPNQSRRAT